MRYLDRSLDEMQHWVATDHTTTLHALGVPAHVALAASRDAVVHARVPPMQAPVMSACELLAKSIAGNEVEACLTQALAQIMARQRDMRGTP